MRINRRRIYILPTRFGLMLGALLVAMLIAALNYNSNLGLAFAFFMASLVLVAMHHCHRNSWVSRSMRLSKSTPLRAPTPSFNSCCTTSRPSSGATSRFAWPRTATRAG